MTLVAVSAAVKSKVQTALTALPITGVVILDPDDIEASAPLPDDYVELRVEPRFGEAQRASNTSERRGWRVVLLAVCVFESNTRAIYDAWDAALRDQFVTVGGKSVLVKFETATESTDDDGRATAAAFYTLTT